MFIASDVLIDWNSIPLSFPVAIESVLRTVVLWLTAIVLMKNHFSRRIVFRKKKRKQQTEIRSQKVEHKLNVCSRGNCSEQTSVWKIIRRTIHALLSS